MGCSRAAKRSIIAVGRIQKSIGHLESPARTCCDGCVQGNFEKFRDGYPVHILKMLCYPLQKNCKIVDLRVV